MAKTTNGVGYKRPPREHCWKKGQSGNPKGRPRGHKNFADTLGAILREYVRVTIDGNEREMTKLEAAARQLVDRAVNGEARPMQQLFGEIHKREARAEPEEGAKSLAPVDRDVLDALFVRLRQGAAAQ